MWPATQGQNCHGVNGAFIKEGLMLGPASMAAAHASMLGIQAAS